MKTQNIKDMGLAMKQVQEADGKHKNPMNQTDYDKEAGIVGNAKKEKDRKSGVGVDANKSIDMSFKTFKAMGKKAPHNGNRTPPGDTAIVKSTMAPAANQKTESVDENLSDMSKYKKVGKAKEPGVKMGKPIKGTIQPPKKIGSKVEAMDPVGKADADIDNDGDVDKADSYLRNRRKAIGAKMNKRAAINRKRDKLSGKAKMRDKKMDRARAVMHGGKNGDKEKSETMTVGEEK